VTVWPRLDRALVLESPERVPDGAGGFSTVWTVLGTLWGHVRAGAGRLEAAEQVTLSTLTFRIYVRAAADGDARRPRPEQRFRAGGRLFRVQAVTEAPDMPGLLVCFATEEVTA
jgi:head-tail adaptor